MIDIIAEISKIDEPYSVNTVLPIAYVQVAFPMNNNNSLLFP